MSLTISLFDLEPEVAPVVTIPKTGEAALRGDIVFENVTTLEWCCGLCSHHNKEIGVLPSKVTFSTPVGDWKGLDCEKCKRFQYLLRVGEDISSLSSWEFITTMPEGDEPQPLELLDQAADAFALRRLEAQWPHAYAFVAQARRAGSNDPSLNPMSTSAVGRGFRCEFDIVELSRYANQVLRGVRSDRPAMTPQRWGEAIAVVRQMGGKS